MFCPECGTEIKDNSIFCTECGTKIEAEKDMHPAKTETNRFVAPTFNFRVVGVVAVIVILAIVGGKLTSSKGNHSSEEKIAANDPMGGKKTESLLTDDYLNERSEKRKVSEEKQTYVKKCSASGCSDAVYKNGYCNYHYGYDVGEEVGKQIGGEVKKGIDDLKDIGGEIFEAFQ